MYLEETDQELATGTGFIYKYDSKLYLITNWHNVTGLNPFTKKPLSTHGGLPDLMVIVLQLKDKNHIQWDTYSINLYDENGKADWYIHPRYRENVDVVALEIDFPENFAGKIYPINDLKFDIIDSKIADDIFILGYPLSMTGGGYFPIWKKGSIATEPDIDYENLPKFLVDTASKPGMSGSPVILRKSIDYTGEISTTKFGVIENFIGIYSGRIISHKKVRCNCQHCKDANCTVDEIDNESQLGIVWKKEVIEEIIIGQIKDEKNFI